LLLLLLGGADDDDKKIQHLKEKEYAMVYTAMFNLMIENIGLMDWWSCFMLLNENRNHDVVHRELEPNVLPCGLQDLRVLLQAL
jgi:hypothetical protein